MSIYTLPHELTSLRQWVCTTTDSKVPMMADGFAPAASTDPDTWSCFELALHSVQVGMYSNIGFVFADNGLVGIDIDDGYDQEGFLTPLATDIIAACKSYTERSRSGRGFHIIVKGNLPFKGKNNRQGVEVYKTARYFIMTGDTLLYDSIVENQAAIDYIVDKYFPEMRECQDKGFAPKIYEPTWDNPIEDGKIKLRPNYPKITSGSRNICLTSLAGMLHSQGYTPRAIYEELRYCNTVACTPQLPENEIATIVNSVTRYQR